jgi:zinc/manganese transport system substrate-binding protein
MRLVAYLAFLALVSLLCGSAVQARTIQVVAAESVYGDIARQIGGAHVSVKSIVSNPAQDPHAFEASPATAASVAAADVVIMNGAGYDEWMRRLVRATPRPARKVLELAVLENRKPGDNPHLWYDVDRVGALGISLADALSAIDPAHRGDYQTRADAFVLVINTIKARIAGLRRRYAGTPVTATEPVFGYMADAIGLAMRNAGFQLAVMNGVEPSAREIAGIEGDLRQRRVKLLIYNRQTTGPLSERLQALAERSGVRVVGVTETEPRGQSYQAWMLAQLDAVERALMTSP